MSRETVDMTMANKYKMEPMKLHVCGCISRSCNCNHRNGGDYWCTQYQCQYGPLIKQSKGNVLVRKAKVISREIKPSKPLIVQQREAQAKVMKALKKKWAMEERAVAGGDHNTFSDFNENVLEQSFDSSQCLDATISS